MIYPKDFTCLASDIEPNTAFLIMPFAAKFDEIHALLKDICISCRIECKRADDVFQQRPILENILNGICRSEIIIADLSGKNANVFYEIGIAHSLKDENSIILISRNIKDVPFDLRHLPCILYNTKNLTALKVALKNKIMACRKSVQIDGFLRNYLRNNDLKDTIISTFINTSRKKSESLHEALVILLNQKTQYINYTNEVIRDLFIHLTILEEYNSNILKKVVELLKVNIFSCDYVLDNHKDIVLECLKKSSHNLITLDNPDEFMLIANICFKLIKRNRFKDEALKWIRDYLYNYRMGRIDIVRARIEHFLVDCNDDDINNYIIDMLTDEKISVRESAADICGQKKLYKAENHLISMLDIETNAHAARSCITALARLNSKKSSTIIYKWMMNNKDKWGKIAVSNSLKQIAITALKTLSADDQFYSDLENA